MNTKGVKTIMALGVIMLMSQSLGAIEQEQSIKISSITSTQSPKIIIRSKYDFTKEISLKVKPDPRFLASDVLIKRVSELGMYDAKGIKITSGFDIDPINDLVLAFSGGSSQIIKSFSSVKGISITASFKDSNGNFVTPPIGSLALYDTSGDKLCFEYKEIVQEPPKMAFILLLDRSGSMIEVIEDVKSSALDFLKALPRQSECALASFNGRFAYHNNYYQSCNNGDFDLVNLQAGGDTNLYLPLLDAYKNLSHYYFKDHQKAVILITDGQVSEDKEQRLELLSAKNDILTFVYFLGEETDEYLLGLADGFLAKSSDIKASLEKYFGSLSSAYNSQKVLQVIPCNGGSYAKAK